MSDRQQVRRDAETVERGETAYDAAVRWRTRAEQAERERDEARKRLHLILSTIYTTHGYMDAEGEIDTAAKFRAIERFARIDWDAEGVSRVV
jgi:hypothetical protein